VPLNGKPATPVARPSPVASPTLNNQDTKRLLQLKQLLDEDLISQEEYNTKKESILASL
jgi:hypothetical protein